jgi:hypothetical protein
VTGRGNRIRRFTENDIPLVAELHRRVWADGCLSGPELERYDAYFRRVFLQNPFGDAALPSLVCEENNGRVAGFVGIVPRRMAINGRQFQAAVSSQFIVDPSSCVPVVALRLAQSFLEGPQDISIADEANDVARRIWEGLGGTTLLLRSLYWTRAVRPAQLGTSVLSGRRSLQPFATAARPLGAIADALATRIAQSHFYQRPPSVEAEDLRGDAVVDSLLQFSGPGSLHVKYEPHTFDWLLDRVRERKPGGPASHVLLRDDRAIRGWYVSHLGSDGIADVLQIAAKAESIDDVLDHLFYNAWRQGAIAVRGRMEPRFMQALSDKYSLFHRRGPWMLVSAKSQELLQAFLSGNAWFSRLDGEWALRLP